MLNLKLDERYDVLYMIFADTLNSYGDETNEGVVILYDIDSNAVTGITIFDFMERYREGKLDTLDLPVKINFASDVMNKLHVKKCMS